MDKSSDLLLREHPWKPLGFADFWKDKPFGFFKAHDFVVLLQPKHGMLEMGNTVAIPVQKHRQIVIDICLCEIIRKLLKIQYSLGNLQAVVVDTTVGILSQTKFFRKPTPNREKSQACLDYSEVRRRKTKLESDIRSPNLGTASIALSKVLLGMVYCGEGD